MADQWCREDDRHPQKEIEVLGLQDGKDDGYAVECNKQFVDHPDTDAVLITEQHEMNASDDGTQQNKRECQPFVQTYSGGKERLAKLEDAQKMRP